MPSRALFNGWPLAHGRSMDPLVLGPTTASFTVGAASGSLIATITGLSLGEAVSSVSPNDGRVAISSGSALVIGLTASAAGTISYTLTTSTGRTLTIAVTASAVARLGYYGFGQSLMDYFFTRGRPAPGNRVAGFLVAQLRTLAGLPATRPVISDAASGVFHDGSTATAEDYTTRLTNLASGGSSFVSNTSHTNEADSYGGIGNYWTNNPGTDQSAITGSSLDNNSAGSTVSRGPLLRRSISVITADKAAGRPITAAALSHGTSDISTDATQLSLYDLAGRFIISEIRSAAGNPNLLIGIHLLGTQYVGSEDGAENIRQIQRNWAATITGVFIAAEEYPYERATVSTETGLSFTAGSNTVAVANGAAYKLNGAVRAAELPGGSYVSNIATNTLTFSRMVNGVIGPANFTATNAAGSLVRVDDVHLRPGSDNVETLDAAGGTANDTTKGFYAVAARSARAFAAKLGLNGGAVANAAGPYISAAAATKGSADILCTITHVSGSDVVLGGTAGWRATVSGAVVTIASLTRVSATQIKATLTSPVPANATGVTIQGFYGAGNKTNPAEFTFDNASPLPYPLQATGPVTATLAEGSAAALTMGPSSAFNSSTAGTSYTASARDIGSAPSGNKRHVIAAVEVWANSTARNISTVTIGGIAATALFASAKQNNAAANGQAQIQYWAAEVPTGTTADVIVTTSSSVAWVQIDTQVIYGYPNATITPFHFAAASSATATGVLSGALNVPAGGIALGAALGQGGTDVRGTLAASLTASAATGVAITATPAQGDWAWTGITERQDTVLIASTIGAEVLSLVSISPVG